MGQWHDNRFKRLHQQRAVILEWAHFVSQRLGLGPVDPDSLDVHPTAYAAARGGQRLADGAWIFRTALEARLLCLWEFQSTQDAVLRLRQAHYALGQLLAGHEAGALSCPGGIAGPTPPDFPVHGTATPHPQTRATTDSTSGPASGHHRHTCLSF